MTLKEIMTQFREEHKLSQRDFGKLCGLSHQSISLYEMGMNPQTKKIPVPDLGTYKKLADGMGITLQFLFEQLGDDGFVRMDSDLKFDEQKLLDAYRLASPEIRDAALTMLINSASQNKKDIDQSAI